MCRTVLVVVLTLISLVCCADPGKIFAGEVHYSRIPVEYWEHRIQMIKALGMNGLSVYIMWNYHEVSPGQFDFSTENRNLPLFLDLAAKYNMTVFIRPGPYVCAEWDFGGMPAWLLQDETAPELRTNSDYFLSATRKYFQALSPILNKYNFYRTGGPIKLLQIENEYGSYGTDMNYLQALRQIWKDLDVTIPQYHADPPSVMANSHWPGANIGVNNGISDTDYRLAKQLQPNAYIFGGEIYPGWLTHWGEKWATRSIDSTLNEFGFLVRGGYSFSMYMVHGGSNFGFTAGANSKTILGDYYGHITSYDYDAPINEQGSVTLKYQKLRDLFVSYANWTVPSPPAKIPTINIDHFTPSSFATLMDNLGSPINLPNFTFFESSSLKMYQQGIVVYEVTLPADSYEFSVVVHDYAIMFIDSKPTFILNRQEKIRHNITFTCSHQCNVKIMVEAMGHINFDHKINTDRKGLIEFKQVRGKATLDSWNHYLVRLDQAYLSSLKNFTAFSYPVFSRATFKLTTIGDTFIDMSNYVKGYIWVNGRNLGRFWTIGPQQRLFCPGVWLKETNEIIVLQLSSYLQPKISGYETLK